MDLLNMILIVGLGNPGIKYKMTRHNLGFLVLDKFQKENNFPDFRFAKRFNSLISQGKIVRKKIILVKPQIFMNNSGKVVKSLTYNLQLTTYNLFVVHDDTDLPFGKIRISKGRGPGGHKGVESVIKELGSKDFVRFRIGTKPITYNLKPETLNEFVLQKFSREEEKVLKEIIIKTCQALKFSLGEGIEKAMTKFNKCLISD
ncbi:MAG: aminoacyl-tRNA hydrolase [Patescibacteria group bacterium]|nr:aminoacyl-tRNA hydrolase [Patescibacteria group bacterium]